MNTYFEIVPYQSFGPIRFGMTREHVRAILQQTPELFRRVPSQPIPSDVFRQLGLFVYYKEGDIVKAVEAWDACTVSCAGAQLLPGEFVKVREFLRSEDPQAQIRENAVDSHLLGVSIWTAVMENDQTSVESVLAFEKGYFRT